ncbi:MAG: hypothetical protein A3C82_01275 [Candidatus Wildermuthbacteria bacterium RIFCSPHIGHO2_02_FULL_47_12]|uniref:Histidine kinase N-terminal 7TM region domain-containing protein n=2 Tax=Parcubacteria group TaxID=1794811 RepID=A0A1G2R1L0_9BACT|nr:MAG: hypothetical protein A3A24_03580 [Candidatus Buchananbacteria bacterium RIFCSPLOWO2_01_FULL_46_12]OHA66736.1 MAG: hypothetical protein A3C82_01275 [Candidatus Wildermuthbacteria bacterium RIFCSPHIGHO2_02_FULL_47_12]
MLFPVPIVSLGNSISFLISALIAWRLCYCYRKEKNIEIRSFFFTFSALTVFFFFAAVPGILSKDPLLLAFFNLITFPLAQIGAYFFTLIPLNLYHAKRLQLAYTVLFFVVLTVSIVYRILGFGPLQEVRQGNLAFWLRPENPAMELSFILSGVLLLISLGLAGFVFMLYAFHNRNNRFLFLRSLLLGIGVVLLGVVGALNYIIGSTPSIGSQIGSSILAAFALLVMALGIFLKRDPT